MTYPEIAFCDAEAKMYSEWMRYKEEKRIFGYVEIDHYYLTGERFLSNERLLQYYDDLRKFGFGSLVPRHACKRPMSEEEYKHWNLSLALSLIRLSEFNGQEVLEKELPGDKIKHYLKRNREVIV